MKKQPLALYQEMKTQCFKMELSEKQKRYNDFLESKIIKTADTGFDVIEGDLHPSTLPHQRDTIIWAAKGGCRAIFSSFGLGKTHTQLELARMCLQEEGKMTDKVLIICPLGVKQEFTSESKRLGITIQYVRNDAEIEASPCQILITNYERVRDGGIDVSRFLMVSLDEASVLRSYGSKTYQEFLPMFKNVRFKYVCTATPSPNKYKELIHYAGFLGIMDTGQALTRFFKRDSTKANNLTIHPHKEREFWLWVSSWALFLTKPSDLGYSDQGYDLPELNIKFHCVKNDNETVDIDKRDGQVRMFRDVAKDLVSASREKRETLTNRVDKALEIINSEDPTKHWIVWHDLESERDRIERTFPKEDTKTVYGSQTIEQKESLLIGFGQGEYRILGTKADIAGSGCNFQKHCHANIYVGVTYKFNDFIQSLHRTHRYGQKHQVEAHIIYTENEEPILKELLAKWERHKELVQNMTDIIKQYGLTKNSMDQMKRNIILDRYEVKGQSFTAVNNDCVRETQTMQENSVGLIVTSIPFSNHYEYTPTYNDFGHTNNDDHFFSQMDFLTPELLRVLQPGRVAAVHVKDRILFGSVNGMGMPTVNPFHAKTIFHYMKHGFAFIGQITIETDVVRENNQTYRLGWSEQCKDGSKMGVGSPEYVLLFRKLSTDMSKAYADVPVTKEKTEYKRGKWQIDARAKWNSSGNTLLNIDDLKRLGIDKVNSAYHKHLMENIYDFNKHVELAIAMEDEGKLPSTFETLKVPARYDYVWSDINRMITLNSQQTQNQEQNHICPLQIDIVERTINRYSNKGDLVYDPFAGIFTVPYIAIKMGRIGRGTELNSQYFRCGVGYCKEAEYKMSVPTLFDLIDSEEKVNAV
jgi:DNA modification methylase